MMDQDFVHLYIQSTTVLGANHLEYIPCNHGLTYSYIYTFKLYTSVLMELSLTTVAFPPTDLTYEFQDDFTSVLLMWVPPSPLGDTTGYRISYNTVGGSSHSVDISDGDTSNYTLSGLEKGNDYNISIVGTSDHFFSMSVAWGLIAIKG